jgi:hypothetical protein
VFIHRVSVFLVIKLPFQVNERKYLPLTKYLPSASKKNSKQALQKIKSRNLKLFHFFVGEIENVLKVLKFEGEINRH